MIVVSNALIWSSTKREIRALESSGCFHYDLKVVSNYGHMVCKKLGTPLDRSPMPLDLLSNGAALLNMELCMDGVVG